MFLFALLPLLVFAHDDHASHGVMDHHDSMNIDTMNMTFPDSEPQQPALLSYHGLEDHAGLMNAHILIMTFAWVVVLPIAVMLSIAGARSNLPIRLVFYTLNVLGLFSGVIYNVKTPDLYAHNSHHPMGWWITAITIMWTFLGAGKLLLPRILASGALPATQSNSHADESSLLTSLRLSRDHNDHGRDLHYDPNSPSSRHQSLDSNNTLTEVDRFEDLESPVFEKPNFTAANSGHENFSGTQRILKVVNFVYTVVERSMLPLGFAVYCTGIVVYGGMFRDWRVFGGLAHFIKGGIFLWYGLLTLGRWAGSFGDLGWAWNLKTSAKNTSTPSAEFVESCLIFVYGATQFFMENLGPGGVHPWDPHNLEHVSITILFFGGGLLGMLIESSCFRKALERPLQLTARKSNPSSAGSASSLNPIPAVIIFLLGIMMSSHSQHSHAAAQLHALWGNLFVAAALARGVTYITVWLRPIKSIMPTRPPSELVVAFCLVGGGGIFMASNEDTVKSLELNNLDAMTVFTVGMGLTGLLMAWTLILLAIKGIATLASRGTQSIELDAEDA